jgi:hypothetical protein
MSTTERAREIRRETGCLWREAVSRASVELDAGGAPVHLASAAKAWAEVLAELHPDCVFVAAVDGVSLDEHERRAAAAARAA